MPLFSRSPESRYAPDLLRHLPVGVAVYRMEQEGRAESFRLVYANAAAEAATGLSAAHEVGRLMTEISPDAQSSGRLAALSGVVQSGQPTDLGVMPYASAARGETPFAVYAVPLGDGAVGVVFEDVSDREALVALQEARSTSTRDAARYRALVEASAAIVWQTPPSGEFETDQPQWRAFTGQSADELMGMGWLDAVHPDDRDRVQDAWAVAVRARTTLDTEYRLRAADGTYRRMHVRGVPVLRDGAVAEWVGTHTDVEAEREATSALATTQGRTQAIFDAIADVVLVYPISADGPGPFVAFNQAALDTYGHSAETLATLSVGDLADPSRTDVSVSLDELMRRREGRFHSVHLTRDGQSVPMHTSARLFEFDGQLCVLAVCRDDTERRAFQRQMSRNNLELERRVAERTTKLEAFAEDLKILHRLTTGAHASVHDRAMAYLRAGCEMFEMPIGILSSLPADPDTGDSLYRVDAVVSPGDAVPTGLTIPLADAFCDDVVAQRQTVTFADAGADARLSCHSAYAERGLRSFIGTPIWIDGALVGTLNFVSPEPRAADFEPYERELAEIMADAMSQRMRADDAAPVAA